MPFGEQGGMSSPHRSTERRVSGPARIVRLVARVMAHNGLAIEIWWGWEDSNLQPDRYERTSPAADLIVQSFCGRVLRHQSRNSWQEARWDSRQPARSN